jgi:arylsulfatase A-like enzyme
MTKPNVILIHAHDLGRWLPCYGMSSVPSPNLDAFANSALVFDQAFATAPLCTPARSSLFTGLSPHVNGLMGLAHDGWRYRRRVRTLPEHLHPYGYDRALVGLQHEHPDPTVLGFGEVCGMGFLPRALVVAGEAEQWLARPRSTDRPFFLTVGMWEVHRPWPAEDYEHADPADVEVPGYLPDNADTREDVAAFYGSIRQFDQAVGQVLRAIELYCDPANTMVIFTTDHGAAFPRAKSTLYDAGVGVALIIGPPTSWGVPPGRRSALASHLDVVPTLLELAGGHPVPELEGRSLLPELQGYPSTPTPRQLFFEKTYHDNYDPQRAVRNERYKYIRNFVAGPKLPLAKDLEESATRRGMGDAHLAPRPPVELYDLDQDPCELTNIAGDPALSELVAEREQALTSWMRATADPLLVDGKIPPPPSASRLLDAAPDLPIPVTAGTSGG